MRSISVRRVERRFILTILLTTAGTGLLVEGIVALLPEPYPHSAVVRGLVVWPLILAAAYGAARTYCHLRRRLEEREAAHVEALGRLEFLQAANALLQTVAGSPDITRTFQTLADRVGDIVPCDRVGLALVTDDGNEIETFTGRVGNAERGRRSRPDIRFQREGTFLDQVLSAREPRIVDDQSVADTYIDANVLWQAGFVSGIVVPLVYEGRALGTLNVVSRQRHAFTPAHLETLRPIGDIIAVAVATQRLTRALGRAQLASAIADLIFTRANEMNGAVQAIIGQCQLLAHEYPVAGLQRDLEAITRQVYRVSEVLAELRGVTEERVRAEVAAAGRMTENTSP